MKWLSCFYTDFDKARSVRMGNDSICYAYGYDHQRIFMEEHFGNTVRTKHYVGMCEYVTEANGTKSWTYLTGPYGVFAVVEKQNGVQTPHYVLKDNLGTWTTITNSSGTVEQRLSYDAWGSQRNPNTWANYTAGDSFDKPMFERGFTGHEHLTAFDLINMNGRMYDPVMSSFLSADRFVQNPMSAQGFNRYAYCMNNPLRFVDPTGWLMGPPKSKSGLIQEYLSDPCRTTREQLREAGIYNIEGSYGFYGGGGNILAGWMEGDGSIHYSSWNVQTEGTGFEVGAWAIPSSFNPMWVNDCQGYCDYGAEIFGEADPTLNINTPPTGGSGAGNWGKLNSQSIKTPAALDIASSILATTGLYTSIKSKLHFNPLTQTWMDKKGVIRSFDYLGNQYTGGIKSYGKWMSNKYFNASRWLNGVGIGLSTIQMASADNIDDRIKYGSDICFGLMGFAPGGSVISTFWFLGGRELVFQYGENMGVLIENGINPGLPVYQPFK